MTDWTERHHGGLTAGALSEKIFSGRILLFVGLAPRRAAPSSKTPRCGRPSTRRSPPGVAGYERGFGAVPPHRDSWGSGGERLSVALAAT